MKHEAHRLGFDLAGATPAVDSPDMPHFERWLADGFAGEMRYLADRLDAYRHPRHVLDGVRSLLVLAVDYRTEEPVGPGPGQGTVSRYAWGADYHEVIHQRLDKLVELHRRLVPDGKVRGVVDTAPLLERRFAQRAGLGWIGRNTMLLNRQLGSCLFLAVLLTSEVLDYDQPQEGSFCGTCRACLDACPTGALVAPHRLDARKCISYLTIELRGSVPRELRSGLGSRLFGCDACQEVCPWNRRTLTVAQECFRPGDAMNPVDPAELLTLDDDAFRDRFRHTPLWRAKRHGLLRNAAIALGNQPHGWQSHGGQPHGGQREGGRAALIRGLHDEHPQVRAACAWALGRYADPSARRALAEQLATETDAETRAEIEAALNSDTGDDSPVG